jgi:hypothetical protein
MVIPVIEQYFSIIQYFQQRFTHSSLAHHRRFVIDAAWRESVVLALVKRKTLVIKRECGY